MPGDSAHRQASSRASPTTVGLRVPTSRAAFRSSASSFVLSNVKSPPFPQQMSAFTLTSTTAHSATFRHYGKLASVGYSQDMEIHPDLPPQPPPRPHSDPMDTNLDSPLPPQQSHSAATEPADKIPPKPPVPQDAPPTAGQEGAPEQGPMGKVTGSACA